MIIESITKFESFSYQMINITNVNAYTSINSKSFIVAKLNVQSTQETRFVIKKLWVHFHEFILNIFHHMVKSFSDLEMPWCANTHKGSNLIHIISTDYCQSSFWKKSHYTFLRLPWWHTLKFWTFIDFCSLLKFIDLTMRCTFVAMSLDFLLKSMSLSMLFLYPCNLLLLLLNRFCCFPSFSILQNFLDDLLVLLLRIQNSRCERRISFSSLLNFLVWTHLSIVLNWQIWVFFLGSIEFEFLVIWTKSAFLGLLGPHSCSPFNFSV